MIVPPGPSVPQCCHEPQGSVRKIQKGASFHEVTSITSVPPIESIHSAFQMAEYLNLLVQHDPHDVNKIVQVPEYQSQKSSSPSETNASSQGKEQDLWIYEQLRRLPIDLTPLITSLLRECTPESCPEMKAGEWQYICVANHQGKAEEDGKGAMQESHCCAIDYILHTLDSHTALWNSSQAFPSRISIKSGSERYFGTQARRISRIFSHAWFAHREIFEEAEAETSLYQRFLALVKQYQLMNLSLLVIPSTAYDPNSTETSESSEEKSPEDPSKSSVSLPNRNSSSSKDASKDSVTTISMMTTKASLNNSAKSNDDDDEFRRDRFATPLTATRIDHGIKDVLGEPERNGRGTLGRGRGKGIRKALFAVDVPAEEDEDEVDTHVEHVNAPAEQEGIDVKGSSSQQPKARSLVNGSDANGTIAQSAQKGDQTDSAKTETKTSDDDQREDRNTTADGIEFNV